MKPVKVSFYIYAENDEAAASVERALYDFIMAQYNRGLLVTDAMLVDSLLRFKDNPLLINQLKRWNRPTDKASR